MPYRRSHRQDGLQAIPLRVRLSDFTWHVGEAKWLSPWWICVEINERDVLFHGSSDFEDVVGAMKGCQVFADDLRGLCRAHRRMRIDGEDLRRLEQKIPRPTRGEYYAFHIALRCVRTYYAIVSS